jgi:hypothetical protein
MSSRDRLGGCCAAAACVVVLSLTGAPPFADVVGGVWAGARGVHGAPFGRSVLGSAFGVRGFALALPSATIATAPGEEAAVDVRVNAIAGFRGALRLVVISPSTDVDVVRRTYTVRPGRVVSVAFRVDRRAVPGSHAVRIFLIGDGEVASALARLDVAPSA